MVSLGGRSLLDWAIRAAQESGVSDRVVVSTEDSTIADVAQKLGADVPYLRPAELSRDHVGVTEVALHALDVLRENGDIYETLIILLPTCPLRRAEDIRNAFALFQEENANFLMSVSQYEHTPFAALKMDENRNLSPYFRDLIGKRSQEMPLAFRANGAIHILDVEAFIRTRSYYSEPLIAYEMPWERSIDNDTMNDLRVAEALLAEQN